ncbi:BrnT family toxin [Martelella endophytica]|uniref:BrnT family toxin n=1 Tax=Martelella endophytica TaxID=1486262 RepID=UPI001FCD03BA|nr:BrnT family toxin [Martelella endophytica]
MVFEYDPAKSAANLTKHGIDFAEAQALWNDPWMIEAPAKTEDEPRFLSVGLIGDKHWAAIWTPTGRGRAPDFSAPRPQRGDPLL